MEAISLYAYEKTSKRLTVSYHNDMKHAPLSPELITQLETDVSCLGDSASRRQMAA